MLSLESPLPVTDLEMTNLIHVIFQHQHAGGLQKNDFQYDDTKPPNLVPVA